MDLAMFHRMERDLAAYPHVQADIDETVAKIVPPTSPDPEAFWRIMWDKPIYANNRIDSANRKIDMVASVMPGQWRSMGVPSGKCVVTRIGKGAGATSFQFSGALAEALRERYRIAPHRLFAIQSAAQVLRNRVVRGRNGPFADLQDLSIHKIVGQLRSEGLQAFWGPVTMLHFLTDMGVACKPDLHLVNSVHKLNGPARPRSVPSEREALAINQFVRKLTEKAYGEISPSLLRRVDLILLYADIDKNTLAKGCHTSLGHQT